MTSDDRFREALRTLDVLFPPGSVIEIRALGDDGVSSGYFSDYHAAANELLIRDNDPRVSGIYVTLNEVRPDLLGRRVNRIKFRIGKKDALTADGDIIRRRWLPIDIDPVRPSGISSSDPEHVDALVRADSIAIFLAELGWNTPLIGDSGNGAHLLYPIDLPNDNECQILIRQVLEFLDLRFSDSRCKVDTANFNASRIWKVYGTVSRKGDHLPERPHRRSRIISVPDGAGMVTREQLSSLIALYPTQKSTEPCHVRNSGIRRNDPNYSFDLGTWLSEHQLTASPKPYQGGTLYVLDRCPFSDAHSDGAFAIQFPSGAIFAGCHHDSCGSGRQRWSELRAKFEPSSPDVGARLARLQSSRIRERAEAEGRIPSSDPVEVIQNASDSAGSSVLNFEDDTHDNEIKDRSDLILSTGDPLLFFLETFAAAHEGDQTVAECLIHSLASRSVINSKGLHVSITGESGKGKSHAIDTMRTLIPKQFRLDGRLSDKALFYIEDLSPGTVITLDDVSLSDQMQEILKGVTTSFQQPFHYRTVNKDRKAQTCTIPERCVWWIAKVEGAGDDQVFNRMLTCWIDDSEEQDLKVLDRTLAGAEAMPGSLVRESDDLLVCRQMWEDLTPVFVVIPYARRIRFQSAENRRNPDMLLDLIRTNAALNQRQRETKMVDGVSCVVANISDFHQAARLFVALNGENGGQGSKLTKRESALIEKMASLDQAEVTIAQLQRLTNWSNGSVGKLLHGYKSYGKSYTGLLEKCPAISYLDRTVTKGDGGYTTLRRSKVYSWDPVLYASWLKGGSVWLADEVPDTGSDEKNSPDPEGEVLPVLISKREPDRSGEKDPGDDLSEEEADVVSGVDPNIGNTVEQAGFIGQIDDSSPESRDESESSGISIAVVDPTEYFLIDGLPDRRRCNVCGKKPTSYQERMTTKRLHQSPRSNRMLCASCYQRAVSRAAASIIPLPGLINTNQMIRRVFSIGRCHVCDLRPAVWSDPNDRINLCDDCYQRESGNQQVPGPKREGPPE